MTKLKKVFPISDCETLLLLSMLDPEKRLVTKSEEGSVPYYVQGNSLFKIF